MVSRVFVDTDVAIDFLTERSPFVDSSSLIFDMHEKRLIDIYLSAVSINNIYYISRRLIGEAKTRILISELIADINIVSASKNEIKTALTTNFKDFEDSIQYVTALKIDNIEAIITRNIKDFRFSSIPVFSPEVYINSKLT